MMGIAKDLSRKAGARLAAVAVAGMAVPLASAFAVAQEPAPAASAPAELTAEEIANARDTFNNFSCGACHALGDAGANGQIGPSLDGNRNLDHDFIVNLVVNGRGAMPGYGGQIADEDIDQMATYIMQVKK